MEDVSGLGVLVDDSSIEIHSDGNLRVKASGITNAMLAGSIADSKLSTITSDNKVSIAALDIEGGSDIDAAVSASDLIIVDDGAGGTNRKSEVSRLTTLFAGTATSTGLIESSGVMSVLNNKAAVSKTTAGSAQSDATAMSQADRIVTVTVGSANQGIKLPPTAIGTTITFVRAAATNIYKLSLIHI